MRLVTSEQMREYDRRTIEELGVPGSVLMENAGNAASGLLLERFSSLAPGPVLVFSGKGNNGGDGYVLALRLQQQGWDVHTLVLAEQQQIAGDALFHLERLLEAGGQVDFTTDSQQLCARLAELPDPALLIDAVLGTGLNAEVRGLAAEAIAQINRCAAPVVALDVPSGIDASNGRVCGCAVDAELTVSFAFAKLGLVCYPGAAYVGDLQVADIGIPASFAEESSASIHYLSEEGAVSLFPPRPLTGHKGTFGHLLLLAGSVGKTGAAALAAEAGMRVGSGLVTLTSGADAQAALAVKLLEVMTEPLGGAGRNPGPEDFETLLSLCQNKQALAVGPGLGTAPVTAQLVGRLVSETDLPLVIDADGLNILAGQRQLLHNHRGRQLVLTPHPGEMSRLIGMSVAEIEADRIGIASKFACEHELVLVLKGARTVVAAPSGAVSINSSGNPGMASGGMGDVLTGMIGGLLAQGVSAWDAARLAVYWHGRTADDLACHYGDCGLLAGDLLRQLPATRRALLETGGERC